MRQIDRKSVSLWAKSPNYCTKNGYDAQGEAVQALPPVDLAKYSSQLLCGVETGKNRIKCSWTIDGRILQLCPLA
jgi:hypothetical protein